MTRFKPCQWLTKYKSISTFTVNKYHQKFYRWQQMSQTFTDNKCHHKILSLTTSVTNFYWQQMSSLNSITENKCHKQVFPQWQQLSPTYILTDNKCHHKILLLTTSVTNQLLHKNTHDINMSPTPFFTPTNYFFLKK